MIAGLHPANGMTAFTLDLCRGLADAGAQTAICSPVVGLPQTAFPEECPVFPNLDQASGRLKTVELLHVHGLWLNTPNHAMRFAVRWKIPCLVSVHGMLNPYALDRHGVRKRLAWHLYQKRALQNVSALHGTSALEGECIESAGLKPKVFLIPPGVDPVEPLPRSWKKAKKLILYLGRLSPEKNLPVLLRAWSQVKNRSGFTLGIAGPDVGRAKAKLNRLCRKLGLRVGSRECASDVPLNEVQFFGEVDAEQREELYRQSCCLVLPSLSENFGLVVAEALAREIPVLASSATPWKVLEGAEDAGRCGWWVPPTPEGLAAGLQEVLQMTDVQRSTLGQNGRKLIAARFSRKNMVDAFRAAYQELTA